MKLNRREIYDEITRLYDENESMKPNMNDILKVYDRLQSESNIKKYNKTQLRSLVNDIFYGLSRGETQEELFRAQGSQKHLNYFDNFFGRGESDKIIEAIKNVGGSTDILKGIKPYKPQEFIPPMDKRFQIIQEWSDGTDGTSPHPISFELYFKGERIYGWGEIEEDYDESEPEYTLQDFADIRYEELISTNKYKPQQTLARELVTTFDGSYTREAYKTTTGKNAIRKRYAKGTVIDGIKVGGRFIK